MPSLIHYVEQLAVNRHRDALYVSFYTGSNMQEQMAYDYEKDETRNTICAWLEEQNIRYWQCTRINSGWLCGYFGSICIDVPFNVNDERYRRVQQYLENENGTGKFEHASFYYVPLEQAIKLVLEHEQRCREEEAEYDQDGANDAFDTSAEKTRAHT
jgi:hypothetical protein